MMSKWENFVLFYKNVMYTAGHVRVRAPDVDFPNLPEKNLPADSADFSKVRKYTYLGTFLLPKVG